MERRGYSSAIRRGGALRPLPERYCHLWNGERGCCQRYSPGVEPCQAALAGEGEELQAFLRGKTCWIIIIIIIKKNTEICGG